MRIYIDESGNFQPGAIASRFCCEVALAIPETFAPDLLERYVALRKQWTDEPEIKGSALSDEQTTAALKLLAEYDVLVEICALDVGVHSSAQIKKFQHAQADGIMNGITPEHNDNARQWATRLRDEWLDLSAQLMTQLYVLVLTLEEVLKYVPNYYAQRMPQELGHFDWVLDPKDIKPTRFEECWRKIVFPLLQSISIDTPWARVDGGPFDYSAFKHFEMDVPKYLLGHIKTKVPDDGKGLDLGKLFRESLAFPDSKNEPGLQLADIVASAFTKAMNGKLSPKVFRLLGPIMAHKEIGQPPVRLIALGDGPKVALSDDHNYVVNAIRHRTKKFLFDD
jgi:hypothetical protein